MRSPPPPRPRRTAGASWTFVFVGAGYAGVEALAELADLVRDALRYYPCFRACQHWVLVDAAPKILPEIPSRLGDYAATLLLRRGVDIRVSTTLEEVEPHAVRLSDGAHLLTSTVVWTAGVKANPLLAEFGLPLDERGRVRVDGTLGVEGAEHVWALGDCASVPNAAAPGQVGPADEPARAAPGQAPGQEPRRRGAVLPLPDVGRDIAELGVLEHPRRLGD